MQDGFVPRPLQGRNFKKIKDVSDFTDLKRLYPTIYNYLTHWVSKNSINLTKFKLAYMALDREVSTYPTLVVICVMYSEELNKVVQATIKKVHEIPLRCSILATDLSTSIEEAYEKV